MIKKLLLHPLLWIFLLALFLRTYQLARIPYGFHVDEVKVGWNAYSLWLTGRDDWWHAFPLHYDSFGDHRPTGIMYATVPALALFSATQFAVRFTPALFGALGVIAIFLLVKALYLSPGPSPRLGEGNKRGEVLLASAAALMAAISPWHITLSRATSEGIIASTLILFGLVLLIKKRPSILLSGTLLISSYFFYHTARLLVPIFVLFVIIFQVWSDAKHKISFSRIILFFLTLTLTLTFALSPIARARLNQVSIFTDLGIRDELDRLPFEEGPNHVLIARTFHNKLVLYATRFANEYFSYFSPKFFLTFGEAKPARYATVLRGPLLYVEFLLVIVGLAFITKKLTIKSPILLLLLLLLSAPIPAALTTEDAPNLHRALLMSPFISILAGIGLYHLNNFRKFLYSLTLVLLVFDFIYFSHQYLVHNPARDSLTITRNGAVVELIAEIDRVSARYRHIYLTNRPDPLYTWYAFAHRLPPFAFNQLLAVNKNQDFTYANFTFSQYRCPSEAIARQELADALAVDTEGCGRSLNTEFMGQIIRSGGGTPYTLWTYLPPLPKSPTSPL